MISHLSVLAKIFFMPDALPAATLPIYPGLGPASRDTKSASDGWVKVKGLFLKQRDKIAYPNLDSARTSVSHDESVPPQDGLDVIDSSVDEDNFNKFISANSTDSDTTEDPILFLQETSK